MRGCRVRGAVASTSAAFAPRPASSLAACVRKLHCWCKEAGAIGCMALRHAGCFPGCPLAIFLVTDRYNI